MFCENCGANLPDFARFCDLCGQTTAAPPAVDWTEDTAPLPFIPAAVPAAPAPNPKKNISKPLIAALAGLLVVALCVGIGLPLHSRQVQLGRSDAVFPWEDEPSDESSGYTDAAALAANGGGAVNQSELSFATDEEEDEEKESEDEPEATEAETISTSRASTTTETTELTDEDEGFFGGLFGFEDEEEITEAPTTTKRTTTATTTTLASYRVIFWTNGGSLSENVRTVTAGNSLTLPTPSRDGYTFLGWYTTVTAGDYVGTGGTSYRPTGGVSLWAHWEKVGATTTSTTTTTTTTATTTTARTTTTTKPTTTTTKKPAPALNYNVGDIVHFGAYDWRVLAVENGKALLITKDCLPDYRPYYNEYVDITWADCDLRKYLNGDFYDSFGADKERIAKTHLQNADNPIYETDGGVETDDYIFCLSIDEAKRYFKDVSDRVALYRGEAKGWWLRSPGARQKFAAYVDRDGYVFDIGYYVNGGSRPVRPALWLNLES